MKISCIGKDSVHNDFDVHIENDYLGGCTRFVVSHEALPHGFFELVLKQVDAESHMVMSIDANDWYGGYGIPDALLPFAAAHLSTTIYSSPSMSETGDYWRKPKATKMWERLVSAGRAQYNAHLDTYRLV